MTSPTADLTDEGSLSQASSLPMPKPEDYAPYTSAQIYGMQGQRVSTEPMVVLLDGGSHSTWMSRKILPPGCNPKTIGDYTGATLAGNFTTSQEVRCDSMILPEFFRNRTITDVDCKIFNAECRCDMIIGRDALSRMGMIFNHKDRTMTWDGQTIGT